MSKKRRLALVGIAAVAFVIVYSGGAASEMSPDEAQDLKDMFMEQTKGLDALGIFLNNFRVAAAMFIPGLGVAVGLFSAYSTGLVFRALAETIPQIADLPPLIILATPFGIMELISYGIAMSQSAILVNTLLRRRSLKPMLGPTIILLAIVGALLLAGAFIEFYMLKTIATPQEAVVTGAV